MALRQVLQKAGQKQGAETRLEAVDEPAHVTHTQCVCAQHLRQFPVRHAPSSAA